MGIFLKGVTWVVSQAARETAEWLCLVNKLIDTIEGSCSVTKSPFKVRTDLKISVFCYDKKLYDGSAEWNNFPSRLHETNMFR